MLKGFFIVFISTTKLNNIYIQKIKNLGQKEKCLHMTIAPFYLRLV
jgi:hypothetical protein